MVPDVVNDGEYLVGIGFAQAAAELFQLREGDNHLLYALQQLQQGTAELPPGCSVTYELEALDILKGLLRGRDVLVDYYAEFKESHGVRPMIAEAYHDGYNPSSARRKYGSWHRFVDALGDLSEAEEHALERAGQFLSDLEITPMTKSFKMLVILAMLNAGKFPGVIDIAELDHEFRDIASKSAHLRADLGDSLSNPSALRRLIEENPIAAWAGDHGTGGRSYFAYENESFRTTFDVPPQTRQALVERLAEYLDRGAAQLKMDQQAFSCKVNHSGNRVILFPLDRHSNPQIPSGWTGEKYEANFARVAVNVIRRPGSNANELSALMRSWFGPRAGMPGTNHWVTFTFDGTVYHLSGTGQPQ